MLHLGPRSAPRRNDAWPSGRGGDMPLGADCRAAMNSDGALAAEASGASSRAQFSQQRPNPAGCAEATPPPRRPRARARRLGQPDKRLGPSNCASKKRCGGRAEQRLRWQSAGRARTPCAAPPAGARSALAAACGGRARSDAGRFSLWTLKKKTVIGQNAPCRLFSSLKFHCG